MVMAEANMILDKSSVKRVKYVTLVQPQNISDV